MDDKPIVWCLIAKWGPFDWQTRCVADDDAPQWLASGWLNYMRDPFSQDARRKWEMDQREAHLKRGTE